MRIWDFTLAVLLTVATLVAGEEKPKPSDDDVLQGTWKVLSETANGELVAKEVLGNASATFSGETYISRGPKQTVRGRIVLNESADPKQIDLIVVSAGGRSVALQGIYRLDGDKLTVCTSGGGQNQKRPDTFGTVAGDDRSLVVFQRIPDTKLIQGMWNVVALVGGGKNAPQSSIANTQVLIKGGQISLDGKLENLRTYSLDLAANPKAMDIAGSVEGQTSKAIYQLDGDTLKLCFSQSTKLERPTSFNTAGTKYLCFTLKRDGAATADDERTSVEGTWERQGKGDDDKPVRIVKQHRAGKTTLTVYDESGKVMHQHKSKYRLKESAEVRVFVYYDMEATAGPVKGRKRPGRASYAFRIDGKSFYEFRGALVNDPVEPAIVVWQRAAEQ